MFGLVESIAFVREMRDCTIVALFETCVRCEVDGLVLAVYQRDIGVGDHSEGFITV